MRFHRWRMPLRLLAAALFCTTGVDHFVNAGFFEKIVPPIFPDPKLLVAVSGICEIAGGLGLLFRPLRRSAGWGLIALLVAVFPANVYMALYPDRVPHGAIPVWALWLRLPFQPVMMVWIWFAALS